MEAKKEKKRPRKYLFRYVNIRGGASPNHMSANFVKSDTYIATCKNAVKTSKIIIYNICEIESVGLPSDQLS